VFKKPFLMAISVFLVSIIAFMAFMPVFATEDSVLGGMEITPELKETNKHVYYSFLSGRLISSFPTALIQDEFGEREIVLYPPEYAGRYLDESGTQHIILTKNADYAATIRNYQEIMGTIDEEIIYEVADFSLSYLYGIQDTLFEFMPEFDISAIGINEITNKIGINIDRSRENDVLEFLYIKFDDFDSSCITFSDPVEIRLTEYSYGIFGGGKAATIVGLIVVVLTLTVVLVMAGLCLYFRKRGKRW